MLCLETPKLCVCGQKDLILALDLLIPWLFGARVVKPKSVMFVFYDIYFVYGFYF